MRPLPTRLLALCNAADAAETLCFAAILTSLRLPDSGRALNEVEAGLAASAVFAGMLVGGVTGGYLGEARKRAALRACLALDATAGAALGALVPALPEPAWVPAIIAVRFVAGLGVGGSTPIIFALVAEASPHNAEQRAADVNTVAWGWTTGAVFASLAAWLILSAAPGLWRALAFAAAAPAGVALAWMSAATPAALASPPPAASVEPPLAAPARDEPPAPRAPSPRTEDAFFRGLPPAHQHQPTGAPPTRSRVRFALLLAAWFTLNFTTYGVSTWITSVFAKQRDLDDPYLGSLFFALAGAPGNVLGTWLAPRLPRRLFALSAALACALSTAVATLASDEPGGAVVLASCFFAAFASWAWIALDLVSAEEFPSSTTLGVAAAFGRFGSIVANMLNPWLLGRGLVLPVAGLVVLASGVVTERLAATSPRNAAVEAGAAPHAGEAAAPNQHSVVGGEALVRGARVPASSPGVSAAAGVAAGTGSGGAGDSAEAADSEEAVRLLGR